MITLFDVVTMVTLLVLVITCFVYIGVGISATLLDITLLGTLLPQPPLLYTQQEIFCTTEGSKKITVTSTIIAICGVLYNYFYNYFWLHGHM